MNKVSDDSIVITHTAPAAMEFNQLRTLVGWACMTEQQTQVALNNSLFVVSARIEAKLVGFARIIGDSVMYFYVQDVMVDPSWQGHGFGHQLMIEIEDWLAAHTQPGCAVGLMASKGKEGFYQRFGYQIRPGDKTGAGMYRFYKL